MPASADRWSQRWRLISAPGPRSSSQRTWAVVRNSITRPRSRSSPTRPSSSASGPRRRVDAGHAFEEEGGDPRPAPAPGPGPARRPCRVAQQDGHLVVAQALAGGALQQPRDLHRLQRLARGGEDAHAGVERRLGGGGGRLEELLLQARQAGVGRGRGGGLGPQPQATVERPRAAPPAAAPPPPSRASTHAQGTLRHSASTNGSAAWGASSIPQKTTPPSHGCGSSRAARA